MRSLIQLTEFMTKDWRCQVKAFVISLGVSVASLYFFRAFVDFGN